MRVRQYGRIVGLVALGVLLTAMLFPTQVAQAQNTVLNYFSQVAGGNTDNVLNINGTLNFEDKATVIDHGSQAATGYATLTTNLSGGITDCVLTLKSAAAGTAPGLDPYHVTAVTTTGSAVLDIHVWKVTGSGDATLIKSTTAATVGYVCMGAD